MPKARLRGACRASSKAGTTPSGAGEKNKKGFRLRLDKPLVFDIGGVVCGPPLHRHAVDVGDDSGLNGRVLQAGVADGPGDGRLRCIRLGLPASRRSDRTLVGPRRTVPRHSLSCDVRSQNTQRKEARREARALCPTAFVSVAKLPLGVSREKRHGTIKSTGERLQLYGRMAQFHLSSVPRSMLQIQKCSQMVIQCPNPYPERSNIAEAFSTDLKAGRGEGPSASRPISLVPRPF